MLKVERSTDYLKGASLEITEPIEEEQNTQQSSKSFQPKPRIRRQYSPNDNNLQLLSLIARCKQDPALINDIKGLLNDVDINYRDKDGDTFLHAAIQEEHQDVVKLLLERGAKIDIENNVGKTPLSLANELDNSNPNKQSIIQMLDQARQKDDKRKRKQPPSDPNKRQKFDQDNSFQFAEKTLNQQDYQVWLTQEDIANIARIKYGWYGENSNVLFEVIGSLGQLDVELKRHKEIPKAPSKQSLIFIINLNSNHWVTLVIIHQNQQFSAYYINSFGDEITSDIRDKLNSAMPGIQISNPKFKQQEDGYNCGIFALENARIINDKIKSGKTNLEIEQALKGYELTSDDLKNKRKEFAEALQQQKRTRTDSDSRDHQSVSSEIKESGKRSKPSTSSNLQQSSDSGQQTTNKRPFSETDSQEEVSQNKKVKHEHERFLDNSKQPEGGLKLAQHGNLFQLKLLMLFLWRAKNNQYNSFRIATEMGEAEKFDDVVLQYKPSDSEKWKFSFLQAKHKDDSNKDKIGEKELLSTNNDDSFSLQKYFHSYMKIKRRIEEGSIYSVFTDSEVEDLIICTNTDFDSEQLRSRFEEKNIEDDQILRLDKVNNLQWENASIRKLENREDELIKKLKPILKDTSDFNRLVEELADKILSDDQINNKDLFKEYCYPLIRDIFDIKSSPVKEKEGSSEKYQIFLKQQSNDVRVQDFMNSLLREIIFKDKGSKGDSWENKAIKISKDFGKTPLPSDEGQLKKIAKVLAEKIRNNEELTPLDFLDQNVSESKYYHIALIKDKVINVKDKKFYGDFFKKSGGHLRDYLRDEMYKMGEIKVKTFAALEGLLKNRELNISEEFGKSELPSDYAKLEELAKNLAEKVKNGEQLTRSDFEDYHVELAKELIDTETSNFKEIFINRKVKKDDGKYDHLSSLSKAFRRIFLDKLIIDIAQPDIKWVYDKEIRVSDGFKKAFRASKQPNIDNPVIFA
ncbi:MAG: ankyrin repeat domain-containing protein [Rickettsiaceae bacterium]|nr:ankyrin repeat domain-containing protein [Rickettsiaceae bacterium]